MPSEFDKLQKLLATFFLWINHEPREKKFVFKLEEGKIHFTFRIWEDTREVDLHRTDENYPQGDPKRHTPFFRISYFSIGRILVAMKRLQIEKMGHFLFRNQITVGKLKRHQSILVPLRQEHAVFDNFLRIQPRKSGKKVVRLNSQIDLSKLVEIVMPEDALQHPIRSFTVYQYRRGRIRMRGHVYRYPETKVHGERSFVYFSKDMHRKLMKGFGVTMYEVLKAINFQNKEKVLQFMRNHLLNTYFRNHPKVKAMRKKERGN